MRYSQPLMRPHQPHAQPFHSSHDSHYSHYSHYSRTSPSPSLPYPSKGPDNCQIANRAHPQVAMWQSDSPHQMPEQGSVCQMATSETRHTVTPGPITATPPTPTPLRTSPTSLAQNTHLRLQGCARKSLQPCNLGFSSHAPSVKTPASHARFQPNTQVRPSRNLRFRGVTLTAPRLVPMTVPNLPAKNGYFLTRHQQNRLNSQHKTYFQAYAQERKVVVGAYSLNCCVFRYKATPPRGCSSGTSSPHH